MADIDTASAEGAVCTSNISCLDLFFVDLLFVLGFGDLQYLILETDIMADHTAVTVVIPLYSQCLDFTIQPISGAVRADIGTPCSTRDKDLQQKDQYDPDQCQTPTIGDGSAKNAHDTECLKDQIATGGREDQKYSPEDIAYPVVKLDLFDNLFVHKGVVPLFSYFGKNTIGADPRTVAFPPNKEIKDNNSANPNDDIDMQMVLCQEHLQCRKWVNQVKPKKSGAIECAFKCLNIDCKGEKEE
jgi:hypothetical protein